MNHIQEVMASLEILTLHDQVIQTMAEIIRGSRRLWVAGNGGSAAIASHFVVDVMKTSKGINPAVCLTDNVPLLTALSNDISYDTALAEALKLHKPHSYDVLLVISSSGNSKNIVSLVEAAKAMDMTTMALTGFTGGKVLELAEHNVHIMSSNYGVIEDCHHIVMHDITERLKRMNP